MDSFLEYFLKNADFLKNKSSYITSLDDYMNLLSKNESGFRKSKNLTAILTEQEKELGSISSFMITPVQRVPRYELLLKELLKYTKPYEPEYAVIEKLLEKIKTIAKSINEFKRQAEQSQASFSTYSEITEKGTAQTSIAESNNDSLEKTIRKILLNSTFGSFFSEKELDKLRDFDYESLKKDGLISHSGYKVILKKGVIHIQYLDTNDSYSDIITLSKEENQPIQISLKKTSHHSAENTLAIFSSMCENIIRPEESVIKVEEHFSSQAAKQYRAPDRIRMIKYEGEVSLDTLKADLKNSKKGFKTKQKGDAIRIFKGKQEVISIKISKDSKSFVIKFKTLPPDEELIKLRESITKIIVSKKYAKDTTQTFSQDLEKRKYEHILHGIKNTQKTLKELYERGNLSEILEKEDMLQSELKTLKNEASNDTSFFKNLTKNQQEKLDHLSKTESIPTFNKQIEELVNTNHHGYSEEELIEHKEKLEKFRTVCKSLPNDHEYKEYYLSFADAISVKINHIEKIFNTLGKIEDILKELNSIILKENPSMTDIKHIKQLVQRLDNIHEEIPYKSSEEVEQVWRFIEKRLASKKDIDQKIIVFEIKFYTEELRRATQNVESAHKEGTDIDKFEKELKSLQKEAEIVLKKVKGDKSHKTIIENLKASIELSNISSFKQKVTSSINEKIDSHTLIKLETYLTELNELQRVLSKNKLPELNTLKENLENRIKNVSSTVKSITTVQEKFMEIYKELNKTSVDEQSIKTLLSERLKLKELIKNLKRMTPKDLKQTILASAKTTDEDTAKYCIEKYKDFFYATHKNILEAQSKNDLEQIKIHEEKASTLKNNFEYMLKQFKSKNYESIQKASADIDNLFKFTSYKDKITEDIKKETKDLYDYQLEDHLSKLEKIHSTIKNDKNYSPLSHDCQIKIRKITNMIKHKNDIVDLFSNITSKLTKKPDEMTLEEYEILVKEIETLGKSFSKEKFPEGYPEKSLKAYEELLEKLNAQKYDYIAQVIKNNSEKLAKLDKQDKNKRKVYRLLGIDEKSKLTKKQKAEVKKFQKESNELKKELNAQLLLKEKLTELYKDTGNDKITKAFEELETAYDNLSMKRDKDFFKEVESTESSRNNFKKIKAQYIKAKKTYESTYSDSSVGPEKAQNFQKVISIKENLLKSLTDELNNYLIESSTSPENFIKKRDEIFKFIKDNKKMFEDAYKNKSYTEKLANFKKEFSDLDKISKKYTLLEKQKSELTKALSKTPASKLSDKLKKIENTFKALKETKAGNGKNFEEMFKSNSNDIYKSIQILGLNVKVKRAKELKQEIMNTSSEKEFGLKIEELGELIDSINRSNEDLNINFPALSELTKFHEDISKMQKVGKAKIVSSQFVHSEDEIEGGSKSKVEIDGLSKDEISKYLKDVRIYSKGSSSPVSTISAIDEINKEIFALSKIINGNKNKFITLSKEEKAIANKILSKVNNLLKSPIITSKEKVFLEEYQKKLSILTGKSNQTGFFNRLKGLFAAPKEIKKTSVTFDSDVVKFMSSKDMRTQSISKKESFSDLLKSAQSFSQSRFSTSLGSSDRLSRQSSSYDLPDSAPCIKSKLAKPTEHNGESMEAPIPTSTMPKLPPKPKSSLKEETPVTFHPRRPSGQF